MQIRFNDNFMRIPTYHEVFILLLGAAVGSIITYFISTREKSISPDEAQSLAKCELEAMGKYNLNVDEQFDQSRNYIRVCMRMHNYKYDEDNPPCDKLLKEYPAFRRYMKQADEAKTEAEKEDARINIGRIVIGINSYRATQPECYVKASK